MAQEKTEKTRVELTGGKVRPVDDVIVYTTEALKSIYPKVGTAVKVHKMQAEKLIESGKAVASFEEVATKSEKSTAGKSKNEKEEEAALKSAGKTPLKDEDSL